DVLRSLGGGRLPQGKHAVREELLRVRCCMPRPDTRDLRVPGGHHAVWHRHQPDVLPGRNCVTPRMPATVEQHGGRTLRQLCNQRTESQREHRSGRLGRLTGASSAYNPTAAPPLVSDQVLPCSTSMSWGRPSMRSAMMLRSTWDVPPPTVRAGLKRKPVTHSSHSGPRLSLASMPLAPSRSLAKPNTL